MKHSDIQLTSEYSKDVKKKQDQKSRPNPHLWKKSKKKKPKIHNKTPPCKVHRFKSLVNDSSVAIFFSAFRPYPYNENYLQVKLL